MKHFVTSIMSAAQKNKEKREEEEYTRRMAEEHTSDSGTVTSPLVTSSGSNEVAVATHSLS